MKIIAIEILLTAPINHKSQYASTINYREWMTLVTIESTYVHKLEHKYRVTRIVYQNVGVVPKFVSLKGTAQGGKCTLQGAPCLVALSGFLPSTLSQTAVAAQNEALCCMQNRNL